MPQEENAAGKPLNERQKRFCELYAKNPDGRQAAIDAGYSPTRADSYGSQLLSNPKVAAYLKTLTEPERDGRIADAAERQRFWTEVMRGQGNATFVTKEGLATGSPDWPARIRAAELLAKAQGDFKDTDEQVRPAVVINLPQRAMTQDEIEEARRANGNA